MPYDVIHQDIDYINHQLPHVEHHVRYRPLSLMSESQRSRDGGDVYILTIPSGISPLHDRHLATPVINGVIMNPYVPVLSVPTNIGGRNE